ncbi:hypothetical protein GCM10009738_78830 [Kitasatospora viridis]
MGTAAATAAISRAAQAASSSRSAGHSNRGREASWPRCPTERQPSPPTRKEPNPMNNVLALQTLTAEAAAEAELHLSAISDECDVD